MDVDDRAAPVELLEERTGRPALEMFEDLDEIDMTLKEIAETIPTEPIASVLETTAEEVVPAP